MQVFLRSFPAFTALMGLTAFMACTADQNGPRANEEDHSHEKSFSWDSGSAALAKRSGVGRLSTLQTSFSDTLELAQAIQGLEQKLKDPAFTDSLWKPVDYSCDELELAIWNTYGTLSLKDSVVFDEAALKSRCERSEDISEAVSDSFPALGKRSDWKWWSESEVSDRQYPYKMIGRSWHNFNLAVYKSTGGETQFEKRRSKLGVTAWYDTDATRIGVRVYLIDCSQTSPRQCVVHHSQSSWYKNDDYVSERDAATGTRFRFYAPAAENNWTADIKSVDPRYLQNFKIAAAAFSMHSVDHAGLQFRAMSSSGVGDSPVAPGSTLTAEYVTW